MNTKDLQDIARCAERYAARSRCSVTTSLRPDGLEITMASRGAVIHCLIPFRDLDHGRLGPEGVYDHALMAAMAEIDKIAEPT